MPGDPLSSPGYNLPASASRILGFGGWATIPSLGLLYPLDHTLLCTPTLLLHAPLSTWISSLLHHPFPRPSLCSPSESMYCVLGAGSEHAEEDRRPGEPQQPDHLASPRQPDRDSGRLLQGDEVTTVPELEVWDLSSPRPTLHLPITKSSF